MKRLAIFLFILLVFCGVVFGADDTALWTSVSAPVFNPERYGTVSDASIVHDALKIHLKDGSIHFSNAVEGVMFAAGFRGHGTVQVAPPNSLEAQQLRLQTGSEKLEMTFTEAAFMFGESLPADFQQKVKWGVAADNSLADLYRKRQDERENVGAEELPRLIKAVLSADRKRDSYFAADLKTDQKGWIHVVFDPLELEEIRVGRWTNWEKVTGFDTWLNFPAGGRDPIHAFDDPMAREDFHIASYQIDARVKENADLSSVTKVDLDWKFGGERVAMFVLDANLRVDSVKDDKGIPLAFFQPKEPKDRTQSYGDYVAVVLAQPSVAGQRQTLTFSYAGKRVVRRMGGGNFFCETYGWYPEIKNTFATRSDFQMTFHSPKKYTLVATASKIGQKAEGNETITEWKSEIPLSVAGFAFGDYKLYTEKVGATEIQVYGNRQEDDSLRSISLAASNPLPSVVHQRETAALGSLNASNLVKTVGIEVANTMRLFEAYYGPYPYKQLAVTNIPYSYGQGWPGLLYLSVLSFLDSGQRHQLGVTDQVEITDFFRAHESSHQWWGHRVGWKSYHDQWLSEGFAQFSGNLYVQLRRNMKEFTTRLRVDREALQYRDFKNRTYESLGPIWMGTRLSSGDAPSGYSEVVYNKGGYVLQMIRAMLADPRSPEPDRRFMDLMKAFCEKYNNRPASTADFQAIVEQFMTQPMDLERNRKMDWFFRQYVYGTGVPQYEFRYNAEQTPDNKWKITGKITQSRVPEGWKDCLPLYIQSQGKTMRVGLVSVAARETPIEFLVGFKPDKLTLNEYEDTLADVKQ